MSEFSRLVDERAATLTRVLDLRGQALTTALAERIQEITHILDDRTGNAAGLLEMRGEAITGALGHQLAEIEQLFEGRAAAFHTVLDDRGNAMVNALGERVLEIGDLFDRRGTALVDAIGERGGALTREVAAVGETVTRALDERSTAILTGLQARIAELTTLYGQSTEALRRAVDEGTASTVATLAGTNERLQGDLNGVLGRLQEASGLLRDVLVHGSGDLGALHEGLVGRIDQLETILSEVSARTGRASGEVAGQVEALRGVTDGALKQAGDLVASLDERGRSLAESTREQLRALAEATGTLEQVEARMGAALGERRQALEGLLARIGERSNELEGVTTAFTRLVEDSLRNAEAKARQIGAVLAEQRRGDDERHRRAVRARALDHRRGERAHGRVAAPGL